MDCIHCGKLVIRPDTNRHKIYIFVKTRPGNSIKNISQKLKLNYVSVHREIQALKQGNLIKENPTIRQGRKEKRIFPMEATK